MPAPRLHGPRNPFVNINLCAVAAEGNAGTQAADGTAVDGDAERFQGVTLYAQPPR